MALRIFARYAVSHHRVESIGGRCQVSFVAPSPPLTPHPRPYCFQRGTALLSSCPISWCLEDHPDASCTSLPFLFRVALASPTRAASPLSAVCFVFVLPAAMARFLYRILRVVNFVGSVEESQLRGAMRSSAVMSRLQSMIAADLDKPLSYALPLTGNAMAPLFNADVSDMQTRADRLVIRRLAGNTQSFLNRVYVDDVVVIRDPNDARRKYVRRITALEGAHMASDNQEDPPFRVPPRHCWVARDNRSATTAPDSTYFGPLSLDYIIGRVMYAIRTATDHGRVPNSPYAMASDSIVLAQEPITMHLHPPPDEGKQPPQEKDEPIEPPE